MSIPISEGDPLPLIVYWSDKTRNDLIVKAQLYQRYPFLVLETDLALDYIPLSEGIYINTTILMPNTEIVDARYDVYEPDGTTLITSGDEVFILPQDSGGGGGGSAPSAQPVAGIVRSLSMVSGTVTCESI